jgi:hypothetical protein
MDNRIVIKDKKFCQTFFFQTTILCEPNIDGYGGVPAGCQCDKDNVIWIADMRLYNIVNIIQFLLQFKTSISALFLILITFTYSCLDFCPQT